MTVGQADELIAVARSRDRLIVANLMQRYNPLFGVVRRLVEGRVLGEVLHGSFENYASDENLAEGHWFWDRSKSGGIFVEHGVHFFDLFERSASCLPISDAEQFECVGFGDSIQQRAVELLLVGFSGIERLFRVLGK